MIVLYEKNQICLRLAHLSDAALLAPHLREADRAELAAVWPGISPEKLLDRFLALSSVSVVLEYRQRPVALGGIYPLTWLGQRACVWLLTGEEIEKIPVTFVRLAKHLLRTWLLRYPVLTNRVDTRYRSAGRLITRLGGIWTGEEELYGGVRFSEFIFRRRYGRNCK